MSRSSFSPNARSNKSVKYVHTISEPGRVLPSDSRWNSIELNFNMLPQSSNEYESIPSPYSMSVDYDLVITDKARFKRFLFITLFIILISIATLLLFMFLPKKHEHHDVSNNLTLAVNHALTFFDAQKSGRYPKTSAVRYRGDSGIQDGQSGDVHADLSGGFYDSGNNIKFSFSTAYMVTLLSWSVIEYHQKYEDVGELDHVKDIIRWGSDYLLKVFVPANATSNSNAILYSQVGGSDGTNTTDDDLSCWQRPEDMTYPRPVSHCNIETSSDLAGEITAALSASSIVFRNDTNYREGLVAAAESLFELSNSRKLGAQGSTYRALDDNECIRQFYNSTSFEDELLWGATWLFFATGNRSYLDFATSKFNSAVEDQADGDDGVFYWNNKVLPTTVLFTRLLYFRDLGYPYEEMLVSSSNMVESVMCKYVSEGQFSMTPGGLFLLKPNYGSSLELAATASFLSKLYKDYLHLLRRSAGKCGSNGGFSLNMLHNFSISQIGYILGNNPMKMSYMVGFGENYPTRIHHRSGSIPWNGHPYSCSDGQSWFNSVDPNPNVVVGAMVNGPNSVDIFMDDRDKPQFTEPSIASNAGLVAALIALHDDPTRRYDDSGLDQNGIFYKIRPSS